MMGSRTRNFLRSVFRLFNYASVIIVVLIGNAASQDGGSTPNEVNSVLFVHKGGPSCHPGRNTVLTPDEYRLLMDRYECIDVFGPGGFDPAKKTLIAFVSRPGCVGNLDTSIRSEAASGRYVVKIVNSPHRCASVRPVPGWILSDRFAEGSSVVFEDSGPDYFISGPPYGSGGTVLTLDGIDVGGAFDDPKAVQVKEMDTDGCLQMGEKGFSVIGTREELDAAIRNDASRERCLERFRELTMEENTILGYHLSTGYCRRPEGLEFILNRYDSSKDYRLEVSYTDPEGRVCRALSRYDLWVLAPKLERDFSVWFMFPKAVKAN